MGLRLDPNLVIMSHSFPSKAPRQTRPTQIRASNSSCGLRSTWTDVGSWGKEISVSLRVRRVQGRRQVEFESLSTLGQEVRDCEMQTPGGSIFTGCEKARGAGGTNFLEAGFLGGR